MKRQLIALALLGLASTPLWAANCSTTITANDAMQFDKKTITVPKACSQFTVTLKNIGNLPRSAMGHDWVLTRKADMQAVLSAGIQAGLANGYVKPDDKRVIAHTKLLGGGKSDSVTFDVAKLGQGPFEYFCSFPGHAALMRGTLVVQ
ncbi:MAG TPA: azurin [Oleiagrimonas sp.]|nr:azurin [Oleiagrimonas sp.]